MKKIIIRDLKKFGILTSIYLVLQYVAVFCIEEVGMLLGDNINFLLEYFYYFIIVIAVIFLILGSLLLFIYLIIKPAIEDKKNNYELSESIVLYRLLGLVLLFFLGLFNFFVALAVITGFDLKVIFEQSINLYIGLSFGIQAVLSIVLIVYNKIYNNKVFSSKLNIVFNIAILLIIYISGNLYYYYYFQYGMMLLLLGYIFLFLNIKLVSRAVFTSIITKVIWIILLVTIVGLFGLCFIKGENVNKEDALYEGTGEEKYQEEMTYSYEEIDSDFGTVRKYNAGEGVYQYKFNYSNKNYSIGIYGDGKENNLQMQSLENMEHVNIYSGGSGYYIDSYVLESSKGKDENYLICNGSYSDDELLETPCVDDDTKEVFRYLNKTFKK